MIGIGQEIILKKPERFPQKFSKLRTQDILKVYKVVDEEVETSRRDYNLDIKNGLVFYEKIVVLASIKRLGGAEAIRQNFSKDKDLLIDFLTGQVFKYLRTQVIYYYLKGNGDAYRSHLSAIIGRVLRFIIMLSKE